MRISDVNKLNSYYILLHKIINFIKYKFGYEIDNIKLWVVFGILYE